MTLPDVVYALAPRRSDELRYSLRSLRNLPHANVWVATYVPPEWLKGATIIRTTAEDETGGKWRGIPNALLRACRDDRVADRFVYMNDDFFVMEPVDAAPILHRGLIRECSVYAKRTTYGRGFRAAEQFLRERDVYDPLNYELHVPIEVDKRVLEAALAQALAELPRHAALQSRSVYANLAGIGGEQSDDVKVVGTERKTFPRPFLSTNDFSFSAKPVGQHVRAAFPEPGPYERA